MWKKVAIVVACGLFLGLGSLTYAAEVGTTALNFLKLGVGVRAIGMGGAFSAVADDASCIYWNPAGLVQLEDNQVEFMHTNYLLGINYEYIVLAQKLDEKSALGVSFGWLDSGDIKRTTINEPGGTGEYFAAKDTVATLGTARKMGENLFLGVGIKFMAENLDDQQAQTWAVDLGSIINLTPELYLSGGIQNLGGKMTFMEEEERLPLNYRVGIAYKPSSNGFILALDLNQPVDNELCVNIGTEFNNGPLALRGGYASGPADIGSGFSFGFGLKLLQFGLNYAWVPYGKLGDVHRVSLNINY